MGCLCRRHEYMKCVNELEESISRYRSVDNSSARPTSRCILFGGENIFLMPVLSHTHTHTHTHIYIYIYI